MTAHEILNYGGGTQTEEENPWFRVPNYQDPTEEDREEWEAKDAALTDEYFQYMEWKYNKEHS